LLRDYASFAAFELLTSAEKVLESQLTAALGPAVRLAESPYEPLLPPSVLSTSADSLLRCETHAADTTRAYFLIDFGDGNVVMNPAGAGAGRTSTERWVRDTVLVHYRRQYQPSSGFATLFEQGGNRALVYGVKYAPHRAPLAVYGIVTCASALEKPLFRQALTRGPILPAAVTAGVPADSLVAVVVRDDFGHPVFSAGPASQSRFEAEATSAKLGGMVVRASLAPGAVERLAVVQASSSRLPFLVGLFALTVTLTTIAVIQLRREHELARLRSDFVSSVSHELRTPLAQILLFGETLALDRARSNEARHQAAQTIVDEARRLIRMVENVLQLSRTQRVNGDARKLELVSTPLAPLLRSVVAGFEPLATEAGSRIKTDLPEDLSALADTESVRQIVLNLLDNALKYGPKGQTIVLGSGAGLTRNGAGETVQIWVEDEGAGIPIAEREHVFERFIRGRSTNGGRNGGGAGLGLAVVKELVELQRGRVWIETGKRGGARFVVELQV
jgi:signal transduction histidine kinase